MAKSTHEKELERARARRRAERDRQRARNLVVVLIAVLVVGAVGLGGVLLARGGDAEDPIAEFDDGTSDGDDGAATATDDDGAQDEASMEAPQPVVAEPCEPGLDVPSPNPQLYAEQPEVQIEASTVVATISTTCGDILLELDAAGAPNTVANFVALAEDGYFRGSPFHRTINGFMIQGGDPTGTGTSCADEQCTERYPGYQIPDELGVAEALFSSAGGYPRGTLAMANFGQPDSGSAQFFIVQGEPGYPLPPTYAAFGRVLEGMEVVDRIANGPVDGDRALEPVVITGVSIQR